MRRSLLAKREARNCHEPPHRAPCGLGRLQARKVPLNPHHATTCAMDPGSFRVTAKAEQWLSEGMERGLFWTKWLEFSC